LKIIIEDYTIFILEKENYYKTCRDHYSGT